MLTENFAGQPACLIYGRMSTHLNIRTAGRADIPALLTLYGQMHPKDPPLDQPDAERIWQQFRASSGSEIFIGLVGEDLVSTCALAVVPNLTRGGLPYGVIENVVTEVSHRKKGYGTAVLKQAIAAAWQQDCYKVMLLTGSENPATLKFYSGVGFEQNKTGFQIRR